MYISILKLLKLFLYRAQRKDEETEDVFCWILHVIKQSELLINRLELFIRNV